MQLPASPLPVLQHIQGSNKPGVLDAWHSSEGPVQLQVWSPQLKHLFMNVDPPSNCGGCFQQQCVHLKRKETIIK